MRKLDPDLTNDQRNTRSRDATFTPDVSAPKWKMGADIHDGVFRWLSNTQKQSEKIERYTF